MTRIRVSARNSSTWLREAGRGTRFAKARRVEGLPGWAHAVSREGGLRRDAHGGRCLSRGPLDAAVTEDVASSANPRGRRLGSSLPIGRTSRTESPLPHAREVGGRRCPSQTPAASSERGTLDKQPNVSVQPWVIDVNYSCRSATTILAGRGHGSKAFRGDRAEVLRGGDHGRSRRHHRSSLRGVVVVGVVVVGVVVVGPWG